MLSFILAQREGRSASYDASERQRLLNAQTDLSACKRRIDALELACAGMWALLKKYSDASDDDLVQAIHDIDLADGAHDGKLDRGPLVCSSCHRQRLIRSSEACAWCGNPFDVAPF